MKLTNDELRQVIIFLTLYSAKLNYFGTPYKNVRKLIDKFELEEGKRLDKEHNKKRKK